MADITPFTIHVTEALLEQTKAKLRLRLARLDDGMADAEWNELEIGHLSFKEFVDFWRDEYDWRKYEKFLNDKYNHFNTQTVVVLNFDRRTRNE